MKNSKRKAASTIEYIALLMFIIAALLISQQFLLRTFFGRWREVGDIFGHGQQYDPRDFLDGGTVECFAVPSLFAPDTFIWVDRRCYEENCKEDCLVPDSAACSACRINCSQTPEAQHCASR